MRPRRFVYFLLVLALAGAAQGQDVNIRSGHVAIQFDGQFHRSIHWGSAQPGTTAFDPAVQEGIVVSGWDCTSFRLDAARTSQQRSTDPEFGPGLEAIVVGLLEDEGKALRLERRTRIFLPDNFPDVALFQTTYGNQSRKPLHVDRVYSQRVLLDRALAEPDQASYAFASFQGAAYKWGDEYAVIRLQPGFKQSNFQGVGDPQGTEGVGGGMPIVDIWSPGMGVALAHLEKAPQWLSLPVEVRADRKVDASVLESPLAKLGQKEWLKRGDRYETVLTALIFHKLDFYDALRTYGQLLRKRGIAIPERSPESAYQAYWKSWGWQRNFTVKMFMDKLPELKSIGMVMANLDDGWQNNVGDWEPIRKPGLFPNGDPDMMKFVKDVHAAGFRTGLWWYPVGVSPQSGLAKERPDLLVQDETGNYPLDASGLHQLCPAYGPSLERIREVVKRVVADWDFDGLYSDFQGLSAVPPCFNASHHHKSPLDSFQAVPKVFELISKTMHQYKQDPYNEVCICSLPHSPYNMPFYDIANASDPLTPWQVRSRIKVEKAIRGGTFAVGDCYQVPINEWTGSSVPESFETAIGTGGQLTTFYRQLDDRQLDLWKRWFHEYKELGLAQAQYVNLYDLAFDKPEVHVVRKGPDLYYGIFAEYWPASKNIELRGLDRNATYQVYDYGNRRQLGTVKGSEPNIKLGFRDSLLLRLRPAGASAD
jgi:alpha-galactosidase